MTINAIIVDDDEFCRMALRDTVSNSSADINIIAECESVKEAESAIAKLNPHLVFLDIEMPGKSGIEFLSECEDIPYEIIFTTSHEKYALQALKASALDFLLKPVDLKDLDAAMEKFIQKKESTHLAKQVEVLIQHYFNKNDPNKLLAIPNANGFDFVKIDEIVRLQAETNYTRIFLANGNIITVAKTLKDYADVLDKFFFFRVHNAHMINLKFLKKYTKGSGGFITLQDGTEIDVARQRKDDLMKVLKTMKL